MWHKTETRREKNDENTEDQDALQDNRSRASRILQERMDRRHRRASIGRLISYILALILILLLMLWLKRGGI